MENYSTLIGLSFSPAIRISARSVTRLSSWHMAATHARADSHSCSGEASAALIIQSCYSSQKEYCAQSGRLCTNELIVEHISCVLDVLAYISPCPVLRVSPLDCSAYVRRLHCISAYVYSCTLYARHVATKMLRPLPSLRHQRAV